MSAKNSPQSSSRNAADKRAIDIIEDAVSDSYDDLLAIFSAKIELLKLDVAEALASIAAALAVFVIAFAGVAYLATAAAIFLGELFGKASAGYLVMSAVMLSLAVVLAKLAPTLLRNFLRKLIQQQLDKVPPIVEDDNEPQSR